MQPHTSQNISSSTHATEVLVAAGGGATEAREPQVLQGARRPRSLAGMREMRWGSSRTRVLHGGAVGDFQVHRVG